MERLLYYAWRHRLFPLTELKTTKGQTIEVIDTGLQNTNAGPDFFNAKIKIDGILWVGNVEIHHQASDWFLHGHDKDRSYDSVILHVAEVVDAEAVRTNGEEIPQLQLGCPEFLLKNYDELLKTETYPPCYKVIPELSAIQVHSWMASLQVERFEQKMNQVKERLSRCQGNWEDAFFVTLARNLGFGLNGDAFEMWANRIPLRSVDKHRDQLFQVEALFFGQAGLLEAEGGDDYYHQLQKEYRYLSYKFGLTPMDAKWWKFLRLRPSNFPHVRIAQLACLYHRSYGLFSQIMEATTVEEERALLRGGASPYWITHYSFGTLSPSLPKSWSDTTLDLIIINTVVTFLYTIGHYKGDERLCARAASFLEQLKPERNQIIRMWADCGIKAAHAGDSQALIQLKKAYCDPKKCLYCRIGYEYLKRKPSDF